VAEQEGLSQEERERAQSFESEDESRTAALRFVKEVVENDAHISDEAFEDVREAGYSDEQIMEMISNVALTTFSNFINDAIGTEVDVPQVDPVHS
jgi:alkylhydroperoxidase family enzyme